MVHGEEPIAELWLMVCRSMVTKMQPRLSIEISFELCWNRF